MICERISTVQGICLKINLTFFKVYRKSQSFSKFKNISNRNKNSLPFLSNLYSYFTFFTCSKDRCLPLTNFRTLHFTPLCHSGYDVSSSMIIFYFYDSRVKCLAVFQPEACKTKKHNEICLLYTSPSPRDRG